MPEKTRTDRSYERHTGTHSTLKFDDGDGYKEIPITSVDWTRDTETTDVQHNNNLNPVIATTGIRYSGSFEWEGQNPEAMSTLMQQQSGGPIQENRPIRGTLTVTEFNHDDEHQEEITVSFKRVIVVSNDRSLPSDDVSSTTFDWEAEDMIVTREN